MLINNQTIARRDRLHVLPDRKDKVFKLAEQDAFETSSQVYVKAFDQVGQAAASRGALGATVACTAIIALTVAGSVALTSDSLPGMLIGGVLGTAIGATLTAIIHPAAVDGARSSAQDRFVKDSAAPYLAVGSDRWLTADHYPMHDANKQMRGH